MKVLYTQWMLNLRSKVKRLFRNYSLPRWMVFILDSGAIFLAFIFAYLLRFNFEIEAFNVSLAFQQSLVVLGAYCTFEIIFKSFAGLLRHTTIRDIFNVLMATISSVLVLVALTIVSRSLSWNVLLILPLSVLLIHFVTISVFLFIIRIIIKIVYEMISVSPDGKKNILIFGAGELGVTTKSVINSDSNNNYNIIAFLDDKRILQRKKLNGIPVLDPKKLSKEYLEKNHISTVIFAIKNISASNKADLLGFAVDLGLEVLEIPGANSWFNGRFQLDQLKKIDLNDLLGRDPISLDLELISEGLKDKTILVTGAAGSIGSEMVRQLSKFEVRKLILVDQAETPMFHLERELNRTLDHSHAEMIIADVTHREKMETIFRDHSPDMVFHAAAYKHVPLMEENPHEAVRVNVGGIMILSALAIKYKVAKFVMISTDKAVNPANVMGASKRLCEMVLEPRSRNPENITQFVITRFGNVLGSNGSVIPIFRKQIENGGPVTVTHPDITRFFMTIPEACQLVLEAGFMGKGGEIFVFDMGRPIKIVDLAKQMIRLSGLDPDKDIKIEYSGLRPGEKLYEELLADQENTLPTYNPKINIAHVDPTDYFMVALELKNLLGFLYTHSKLEVIEKLKELVPEYKSYIEKHSYKPKLSRTAI